MTSIAQYQFPEAAVLHADNDIPNVNDLVALKKRSDQVNIIVKAIDSSERVKLHIHRYPCPHKLLTTSLHVYEALRSRGLNPYDEEVCSLLLPCLNDRTLASMAHAAILVWACVLDKAIQSGHRGWCNLFASPMGDCMLQDMLLHHGLDYFVDLLNNDHVWQQTSTPQVSFMAISLNSSNSPSEVGKRTQTSIGHTRYAQAAAASVRISKVPNFILYMIRHHNAGTPMAAVAVTGDPRTPSLSWSGLLSAHLLWSTMRFCGFTFLKDNVLEAIGEVLATSYAITPATYSEETISERLGEPGTDDMSLEKVFSEVIDTDFRTFISEKVSQAGFEMWSSSDSAVHIIKDVASQLSQAVILREIQA